MLNFTHVNKGGDALEDPQMELIAKLFCQALTEVVRRPALQEAFDHDLTEVQVACMRHIYFHHQPSIGDIATGLRISNAAATKLVNRLVLKNWVERKEDPKDRRVLQMRLTPVGERMIENIMRNETQNLAAIVDRMKPKARDNLRRSMEEFLTVALDQKEWVDKVCLRCGWAHQTDCPGNLIYRSMTGNDKDNV